MSPTADQPVESSLNLEEGAPKDADAGKNGEDSNRLSLVSKKYDIDGDGKLDPAEQAMRDMDSSNRGFLTNDKVYALMREQLALQRRMFNMKRILIVLLVFTFILTLSNLGTAFAAARLAKDTDVESESNNLINKDNNELVGAQSAVDVVTLTPMNDEATDGGRRDQVVIDTGTGTGTVTVDPAGTITRAEANQLRRACFRDGHTVNMIRTCPTGVEQFLLCSPATTKQTLGTANAPTFMYYNAGGSLLIAQISCPQGNRRTLCPVTITQRCATPNEGPGSVSRCVDVNNLDIIEAHSCTACDGTSDACGDSETCIQQAGVSPWPCPVY